MSGSERDGDVVVERLSPEEAFELLAHETRFRTLEALNEADAPLAFETLRERVGADDPGGFNYHLGKLTGRFVRKVEGEEVVGGAPGRDEGGYALAPPGRRVVGAVLSGGYTKELSGEPVVMDGECLVCGAPMETRFRADGVEITCPECGVDYTHADVSPGILEGWDHGDAPAVVDRWLMRNHASAHYGFCYNCDGRMDVTVRTEVPALGADSGTDGEVAADVAYDCRKCGHAWHSAVPLALLTHPAVVGFHHEHGVDLHETPAWDLEWFEAGVATVTGTDPVRVEVPFTLDGETLVVTVDGSLEVLEERRE